ncbi:Protein of unknown function [Pyronema omphalodes CBS 100304]|uniref:Uncharacterized protein n=1 Tax=Pyronema omphalodes (strain CBS 100304) TaxID=1076935 RepID=U4LEX5_PYROM|nr:Protein of unknown function [Pyronema omphalodes CBS 100304]
MKIIQPGYAIVQLDIVKFPTRRLGVFTIQFCYNSTSCACPVFWKILDQKAVTLPQLGNFQVIMRLW